MHVNVDGPAKQAVGRRRSLLRSRDAHRSPGQDEAARERASNDTDPAHAQFVSLEIIILTGCPSKTHR